MGKEAKENNDQKKSVDKMTQFLILQTSHPPTQYSLPGDTPSRSPKRGNKPSPAVLRRTEELKAPQMPKSEAALSGRAQRPAVSPAPPQPQASYQESRGGCSHSGGFPRRLNEISKVRCPGINHAEVTSPRHDVIEMTMYPCGRLSYPHAPDRSRKKQKRKHETDSNRGASCNRTEQSSKLPESPKTRQVRTVPAQWSLRGHDN